MAEAREGVRRAASLALFPALVAALGAFALHAPRLDVAGALGLPERANDPLVLLCALLVFYPSIAALERWLPHRDEWRRAQGDLRGDVIHLLLSGTLANALFAASFLGVALAAATWLAGRFGGALWPADWPALAQLALALALAELGHYAYHRLSHEQHHVWRLHAAHHAAPRLYWLNATRFQVFDLFFLITCQSFPLIALGAGRDVFLSYSVFAAVYGQLQHSNVELRTGPLDWIFSTPALHRWHHSRVPQEGDNNYGAILSVWDLVFRSFWRPHGRSFEGPVGIGALPRFPAGWLGQQLAPFRWARIRADNARGALDAGAAP
jgi:sterol desaturase/sphingolipid hydroxylase (fatty acid hydroxylase superfamily)